MQSTPWTCWAGSHVGMLWSHFSEEAAWEMRITEWTRKELEADVDMRYLAEVRNKRGE